MAAASIPSTSGIKQTLVRNKQDERIRPPTVEELLIQVENHLYDSTEQQASLIIAVWSCLGGQIKQCRNLDKIFHMLYRESAMMVFNSSWPRMDMRYKRGLARALIQYSQTLGSQVKGAEGLCSALVMANYDPWGDPAIRQLLVKEQDCNRSLVHEFIQTEPRELLLVRVECLVLAHMEEGAIRLLRSCLHGAFPSDEDSCVDDSDWRWAFMEWLLRLLFRKRRLNDLVAESSHCSCHDGVRLIYRTLNSDLEDSESLTETLINLFLVRDLLFKSSYCCTSELMKLWCEFQAKKHKTTSEIQEAARKLLVGHASSSAQFYLFVDILWGKFGVSLLPLYLEMYIRGLTSDLNHLEEARQTENRSYIVEIENHMAAMYFKLFSLFFSLHKEIALECLLSSFSLDPTKERLEWIRKVTLQITKDRAISSSHQPCSRLGCGCAASQHHLKKRPAVVMCDQAIQVGDDSFVEEDVQCCPPPEKVRKTSQEEPIPSDSIQEAGEGVEAPSQVPEQNGCDSPDQVLSSGGDVAKPVANHVVDSELPKSLPQIVDVNESSVSEVPNDNKPIPPPDQNHVSENCKDEENCVKVPENKVPFNCEVGETNHVGDASVDGLTEAEVAKAECGDAIKQECLTEKVIKTDVVNNTSVNHNSDEKHLSDELVESDLVASEAKDTFPEPSENHVDEGQKPCDGLEVIPSEKACTDSLEVPVDSSDLSKPVEKDTLVSDEPNLPHQDEIKSNVSEEIPPPPPISSFEKYENLIPFSHIVLDSKLPGVPQSLMSDFVTVLESMRNKQLKSSTKWSQIKHLCEGYMHKFNNARCRMLNTQLNGSIDSEADSTSEFDLQDFEFHGSDDSVIVDKNAEKSHVFKRFMNADKTTGMATYVNLSDINIPKIPLDKIFCTDHSSSHVGGHKKKHRRHRNHETGKLMLKKKFRHGERAERELAKHRKKKKRKAKKAHVKKHRFTHGKVTKSYLKNKRKKHKQKKKEGNSGFISGDYCSDFSSGELMRLVKEHSNSYSKVQPSTSKHPHSSALVVRKDSSSEASNEPQRKKRKVSFSKKRNRDEKCREKHKHTKSKSSKHKKTILVESCDAELNEPNQMGNSDYSHIVKFSSVKKMEAVQIRQRSVALNLSKVSNRKPASKTPSAAVSCDPNPQFQQFVQQNFESYSPEEIMKMQVLMGRQQPEASSTSKSTPSTNNQSVLKYVCSKTTSYLAQSSKCVIGSDSEASKSPVPTFTEKAPALPHGTSKLLPKPQTMTSNVKRFVLDANNSPYQLASGSSLVAGNALIPVSLAARSYPDLQTFSRNPSSTMSTSQVQAFRIPVTATQHQMNPIVIPLPAGHLSTVSGMSLIPRDSLVSTSGNQSNVIIVKNGNTTQIIQNVQPSSIGSCIDASGKIFTPIARGRVLNPVVSRTVPRIIQQAARNLSQPVIKRTLAKSPLPIKPLPTKTAASTSILASNNKPEAASSASSSPQPGNNLTPESLIVQRAIAEAKRAIAESSAERQNEQKRFIPAAVEKKAEKSPSPILVSSPAPQSILEPVVSPAPDTPIESSSVVEDAEKSETVVEDVLPESEEEDNALKTVPNVSDDEEKSEMVEQAVENAMPDTVIPQATVVATHPVEKQNVDETVAMTVEDACMISSPFTTEVSKEVEDKESAPATPDKETPEATPSATDASVESTSDPLTAASSLEKSIGQQHEVPSPDESIGQIPAQPESENILCAAAAMSTSPSEQSKPLEPINEGSTHSLSKAVGKTISLGKAGGGTPTSEVQTRSFTSISDAVRFSLMDMDDATDSVENQVLQAFQVSQDSSPGNSPGYDNTSTNDDNGSPVPSPSSAVILTTPQNATTTTELNVSRRFESAVEKFAECQSTVTTWILEEASGVAGGEVSQALQGMPKSPGEVDSSGEGDDKPRKKKKRKDRMDRSPESAHKFWCEICHKGFFSAYNLRRHCRNVHKMNLPRGSSDLPFGPKSTPEMTYAANSSQLHSQHGENSSEVVTPPRMQYAGTVQQSCVSPKGGEFMLQSPTRENKTHEFTIKQPSTSQHMQSSDFQMQTPPRISSQPSSHVGTVSPRMTTPTSVSSVQMSPTKAVSKPAAPTSPKFQRLPTSCATSIPQINKVSQISSSQMSQIQTQAGLQQQARQQLDQLQQQQQQLQPLVCQTQQLQQVAAQCSHFQANKAQIVQQRIGQLQLMQQQQPHQLAQAHAAAIGGIAKQATAQQQQQAQQFKKCGASSSKISETEQQIQQQLLANQHLQKLMHIRQNAITAPQLALSAAVSGSPPKASTQCFQSQLAAARQAAAAAQLPTVQQRTPSATGYPHDATAAATSHQQFFAIQPSQEQPSSCPHAFGTQNIVEFSSASSTSYPTIRLSSETNDGLEDLEQFLLENMPWSGGDQTLTHGLAQQQSGNRPSSADSLTLAIPSQSSTSAQNRAQFKIKSPISRPKPRKPVVSSSCSKNLLGNLGRGVKKKAVSPLKKTSKSVDTECMASKSEMFSAQSSILNPQPHSLNLMQQQCSKDIVSDMFGSKSVTKNISVSNINETDSSDSVQCINITPTITPKNASVGINFNTFTPTDKNVNPLCSVEQNNVRLMFGMQNKSSFLDQCNLVNKSCSGDKATTSSLGLNEGNVLHSGNPFVIPGKESTSGSMPLFYRTADGVKRMESAHDVFLGQANSDKCDLPRTTNPFNVQNLVSVDSSGKLSLCQGSGKVTDAADFVSQCRKDGSATSGVVQNDLFLDGKTASQSENAVSEKTGSVVNNTIGVSDEKSDLPNSIKDSTFLSSHPVERNSEISLDTGDLLNKMSAASTKSAGNSSISDKDTDELGIPSLVNGKVHYITNEIPERDCKARPLNGNVKVRAPETSLSNKRDINFNNVAHTEISNTSVSVSKKLTEEKENSIEGVKSLSDSNLESQESNNSDKSMLGASTEETKNNYLPVVTNAPSFPSSAGLLLGCDTEAMPKFSDGHDQVSSQENQVPNGLGYLAKETDDIENKKEIPGSKRIALRLHKSQDGGNEDASYFVAGKPKSSKSSKKPSRKGGHRKREAVDPIPNLVLDINSNIQKTGLFNAENKEKYSSTATNGSSEDILEETQENEEMCMIPRRHISPDEVSPSRLRLRETTKMSVKRMCPCCVDSHIPKKCRAVTKLFVPKVQSNNSKTKSTLKARNASGAKTNTRSSQRLRSRNNAIS